MIIILTQAQIEAALIDYVNSRVLVQDGQRLDIDFKNSRGENGISATIEIVSADAPRSETTEPQVEATPAVVAKVSAAKATPVKTTAAKAELAEDTPADKVEEAPATPAVEAEPEADAPAPAKKSIFASMKQPTGRVGDGDVEAA